MQSSGQARQQLVYSQWHQQRWDCFAGVDWKLVQYNRATENDSSRSVTTPKLYNLKDDIGESRDLASTNPEKAVELEKAWKAWNKDLATPLWRLPPRWK